jgi:hypothetical protein
VAFTQSAFPVFLVILAAAPAAQAQVPLQMSGEQPAALVRDAFASSYGQALADEFGEALSKAADPACLGTKKIAAASLRQRGLDLMVKRGTRMLEQSTSLIDSKAYDEKLAATGGQSASRELTQLSNDADVKRYRELERPIRLTAVLDTVFEQFDRYAESAKIKIAPVSPLASGSDALLNSDPTEASEKALKDFVATHPSPPLRRYLKLSEDAADATTAAVNVDQAGKTGPATFFEGVEADLADICVR